MRKSHFGAVDDAIPDSFNECERVVVFGIEDNALERCLFRINISHDCVQYLLHTLHTSRACNFMIPCSIQLGGLYELYEL